MDPTILAAIIGGFFVLFAVIVRILWEIWKLRQEESEEIKLTPFFSLGYELVGAVVAKSTDLLSPDLRSKRKAILQGIKYETKIVGINVSAMISKIDSLEKFLTSGVIPELSKKIQKKYGMKASSAFEMGVFLGMSPLSDEKGRPLALSHAEKQAKKTGLDNIYITDFFRKVEKISDRLEVANEVQRFILDTIERFENM